MPILYYYLEGFFIKCIYYPKTTELLDKMYEIFNRIINSRKFPISKIMRRVIQQEKERTFLKSAGDVLKIMIMNDFKPVFSENIKIALCELDREDINALASPTRFEILFNLRSPVIKKIVNKAPEIQKVLLIEELSHELAHILGYGLNSHDLVFFKKQRILKYKAILNLS